MFSLEWYGVKIYTRGVINITIFYLFLKMLLFRRPGIICDRTSVRTIFNSAVTFSKKDDSSSSDSDNEKAKKSIKKSKEETTNKLNSLLQLMIEEDSKVSEKVKQLELPKPKPSLMRKKEMKKKEKTFEQSLSDAAKDVASSLGDTTGQTESELLNKLLGRSEPPSSVSQDSSADKPEKASSNLSDVLSGMKVEQTVPQPQVSRAEQVRQALQKGQPRLVPKRADRSVTGRVMQRRLQPSKRTGAQVDIFGAQSFTYFKGVKLVEQSFRLETWRNCMQRELRLAVTHPPRNIYEQMILWTEKGMMWQFPIDNEQGLDEERKVYFAEHIFLEQHLEGWCPDKGPIRHFMELVCVGLSKNYWLTVEEKKQHIAWYKDFFADKQTLLKEIGAGTIGGGSTEKQAEEANV